MSAKLMKRRASPIQRAGRILKRDRDTDFPKTFAAFSFFHWPIDFKRFKTEFEAIPRRLGQVFRANLA
jgi:hypothetical protein